MTFDYRKFLAENDLTTTARLRNKFINEEELPDEAQTGEEDTEEEAPEADPLAQHFSDEPGIEDEPEVDPVANPKMGSAEKQGLKSAQNDHNKLQKLIAQKDEILARYKSGEISLDQYKTQIGTIPNEIKAIQAKMSQGLEGGEDETEEI